MTYDFGFNDRFNNGKAKGGKEDWARIKEMMEVNDYFREKYGETQKKYVWRNGELYEYEYGLYDYSIKPAKLFPSTYNNDFSIFTPITSLFSKIKQLFLRFRFNQSTDDKWKETQKTMHDHLVKEEGKSVEEADNILNQANNNK